MSRAAQTFIIAHSVLMGASFVAPTETKQLCAFALAIVWAAVAAISLVAQHKE